MNAQNKFGLPGDFREFFGRKHGEYVKADVKSHYGF